MRRLLFYLTQLLITICLVTSCTKEEGEGGKGSIYGVVHKIIDEGEIAYRSLYITVGEIPQTVTEFYFVRDTVPAKKEDVFIIYGDNQYGYDDKTSTSYDGSFCFKYLNDGNYTLFTLSDSTYDKQSNIAQVNIDNSNSVYAGDFYIYDGKNSGKCGIVGKIEAKYKNATSFINGVGLRVYYQKKGSVTNSDERSDGNGLYSFSKLDPYTTYIIYAETEPDKDEGIGAASIEITTGAPGTITLVPEILYVFIY